MLGWEESLGENGYMYRYGWSPLLLTWNCSQNKVYYKHVSPKMRGPHRPSFMPCAALAAALDGWSHCESMRLLLPGQSPRSWKGFVSWAWGTGAPPQTHVSGHYIPTHSLSETMVLHWGSHVSFQKRPRWRLKLEAGGSVGVVLVLIAAWGKPPDLWTTADHLRALKSVSWVTPRIF